MSTDRKDKKKHVRRLENKKEACTPFTACPLIEKIKRSMSDD